MEWPDYPGPGRTLRMDVKSTQLGTGRGVSSGKNGKGKEREPEKPNVSEITVTKDQDSSSTDLFREAHGGQGRKMNIIFYDNDKKTKRLTMELENALITNHNVGVGGERPTESFSINFTSIKYKYDVGYVQESSYRSQYDLSTPRGM